MITAEQMVAERKPESCVQCSGAGFEVIEGKIVDCPKCEAEQIEARMKQHAIKSRDGRRINNDFMLDLVGRGIVQRDLYAQAMAGVSTMLIGPTGTGKSLALKFAYNRALRMAKGWPTSVFYAKEYHLFALFRDDDSADEFFSDFEKRKPRKIFLDECFRKADWRDIHSNRDKAKIAHLNYYRFWDEYIYEADWDIECVFVTGNSEPEEVISGSENERALIRRIREVTK